MVDRQIHNLPANFVWIDNYFSVRRVTADLLARGKQSIYLFSGPENFTCEETCIRAFRDAHSHASRLLPDTHFIQLPLTKEQGFSRTISLLKKEIPEVILTTSSLTASGVIEALRKAGRTDLIGYDDECLVRPKRR